ncbi:AMP-binding protein [Bailinhaonella thermotolerans]|uniref:Acyl-CoA synthetase n=1 Tax=Bailinhaonella thermotolerans TaxID=1070861 RepID=A0A3A4B0J4_9ACTN|nr:AMP-binding protein [Bailinhaonella thermotolerans]RJL25132.1 acyl-CoA synthetase [Bailinhaonella thermotolerans]
MTASGGEAQVGPAPDPGTLAGLIWARAEDDRPCLAFEDRRWTWREYVAECGRRAAWLDLRAAAVRRAGPGRRALHVGVLLDNVPELLFLLGGAALAGHVIVGLNTTRTAAELARDAAATDVDVLVGEPAHAVATAAVSAETGIPALDAGEVAAEAARLAPAPPDPAVEPGTLVMLIFTSGTSGRPRAVKVTQRKIVVPGASLARVLAPDDVVYCSMPLFHSGAIMAAYAPAVVSGASVVLRRRFSASGLIPDARAYGCTYLHYVGKALSYVLATPERDDDRDNPLKIAFGNEGSAAATRRFGERFGCHVIDAFGSSETAIAIPPDPAGPPGSLGRLPEGVRVLDPATGRDCPPAEYDEHGRLANAGEAVGELVNTSGLGLFDGYYNDPEADAERVRDGWYWSGDYAYADKSGYVFFAGRGTDRLRVDGENLAAAPVEAVIRECPGVVEAAVYPVPDAAAGDQVMAALVLAGTVDPEAFPADLAAFLAARPDLGPKAVPRYVRIAGDLPQTASHKVIKRALAAEGWTCADPVWWRPGRDLAYRRMDDDDRAAIASEFAAHGRAHFLESGS